MSSDHAPLWITPSHRLKARFVATYRLRFRGDAATAAGARVFGDESGVGGKCMPGGSYGSENC
jgi:hypothetical protein